MGKLLAALYDPFMRATEDAGLRVWRSQVLEAATGVTVEVGAGTGANIGLYPRPVSELTLCEPDAAMRARLEQAVLRCHDRIEADARVIDAPIEALPFEDQSVDTVIGTLVLCSVHDPAVAIAEVWRVLRPGGRFGFIEHVVAEGNPGRARWQHRIEPVWKHVAGNCHLTRDTRRTIEDAGFEFTEFARGSMRSALPIVRPTIRGVAVKGGPTTG